LRGCWPVRSAAPCAHPEAFNTRSEYPFKADMDVSALENAIWEIGPEKVAAVRMEFCGNLLGG